MLETDATDLCSLPSRQPQGRGAMTAGAKLLDVLANEDPISNRLSSRNLLPDLGLSYPPSVRRRRLYPNATMLRPRSARGADALTEVSLYLATSL